MCELLGASCFGRDLPVIRQKVVVLFPGGDFHHAII